MAGTAAWKRQSCAKHLMTTPLKLVLYFQSMLKTQFEMPQSHNASAYDSHYISPHCDTVTGILGLLFGPVGMFSIFRSTSKPSITRPEIQQRHALKLQTL